MEFYRFRPLSRLLEKGELINQEIFFAAPENLNDPMEGFRDIFWKGDAIVWSNFFRHYVRCIDRCAFLGLVFGKDDLFSKNDIPVLDQTSPTPQDKARVDKLVRSFLGNSLIVGLIDLFSQRVVPIRRDELSTYLRMAHVLALVIVHRNHYEHGFIKFPPKDISALEVALSNKLDALELSKRASDSLFENAVDGERTVEVIFKAINDIEDEFTLLRRYNEAVSHQMINREFVAYQFPDHYISALETLIYPSWYTACFMADCENSSVWGSYGESHTAACLIFNADDSGAFPSIRLNRVNGIGGKGYQTGLTTHHFSKVTYENKHLPVDFFRSLGKLPFDVLRRVWYTNNVGQVSPCAADIFEDENEWRQRYWDVFTDGITRKLEAWQHEKEYRLTLTSHLIDFSDPAKRTTKYEFAALKGIIFGMKTPTDKKIEICKIINEKCRATGRTDFNFYQAFYSQHEGKILHRPMSLLKFGVATDAPTLSEVDVN